MQRTMRVRLKLSDFIDTEYETPVMEMINTIHNDLKSFILLFFDILPKEEKQEARSRFTYQYGNNQSIVKGLKELYDCIKFITSDKSTKRQKRNDYED